MVGLLPCVYAAMLLKIPVRRKYFAAFWALERLVRVDPEVSLQCAIVSELLVAHTTMKRALPCVDSEMSPQVSTINETLTAQFTMKGLVPCVGHNVVLQFSLG
jgi:hypothetical protein